MASQEQNKIKRLELENFTCFGKVEMDFSPGINLFIGENGTGKTHLLKVLYGLVNLNPGSDERWKEKKFVNVLAAYFNLKNIDALIRKVDFANEASIHTILTGSAISFLIGQENSNLNLAQVPDSGTLRNIPDSTVFIPPQEMLSWFSGFLSLYNKREISFDKTYFDLSESLGLPLLKNSAFDEAKELILELEEGLSIWIEKRAGKFYIIELNEKKDVEASMSATGINKIAQLIYLIMNGSLTKDTILFWDEPETGLNPKYITLVTKFLITLANAGCQVFVSTHDYLLTHQLSLFAENRDVEKDVPPMRFFALTKGENGTEVEAADTVAEIQSNAILEEYAAYHELQMQMAAKRFQTA